MQHVCNTCKLASEACFVGFLLRSSRVRVRARFLGVACATFSGANQSGNQPPGPAAELARLVG
jgi:hypothetical protein